MDLIIQNGIASAVEEPLMVAEARRVITSIDSNLDTFQLFPKKSDRTLKLSGDSLFARMCAYCNVQVAKACGIRYEG